MTPLAARIAREKTLPLKDRTFRDEAGILPIIDGAHCFECSAITNDALDLYNRSEGASDFSNYIFLPAPITWIEYQVPETREYESSTVGILLHRKYANENYCEIYVVSRTLFQSFYLGFMCLQSTHTRPWCFTTEWQRIGKINESDGFMGVLFALLAMINTPRIIGRRTHLPHAGLQRKLARSKGMSGKFPLHAWTEIVLEVTPPEMGGEQETRLSGHKALHFVRQHLRIRLGQLELVKAHWRGDPALGIKRSRYRLAPPRAGAQAGAPTP